jgi:hypothetical protein
MIVRNEAAIIERALKSVVGVVGSCIICDTGSTDGTQDIIKKFCNAQGIALELHSFAFVDFSQARNQALDCARKSALKFDYLLLFDADMELMLEDSSALLNLTADAAFVLQVNAAISYHNLRLLRRSADARYVGATHEALIVNGSTTRLSGLHFYDHTDGASRPEKLTRDERLLRDALTQDPKDARSMFYLAQTLRDAGQAGPAREAYRHRVAMGGWEEEIWYALYQVALLTQRLNEPEANIRDAYLAAFQYRPLRAESLLALARWHNHRSEWALGHLYAQAAAAIPRPDDILFVEEAAYRWGALDEAAVSAYWVGNHAESFSINVALLDSDRLPESERPRIEANRDYSVPTIAESTARYPDAIVKQLDQSRNDPRRLAANVTLTIATCKRPELFERTVNSFLNCCQDLGLIGRFICIDDNSSDSDRRRMQMLYPFFEFILKDESDKGHARSMNLLMDTVSTPYWLHLEDDWHFLVSTNYLTCAQAILCAEPAIAQVTFNRNYAETLADRNLVGGGLRHLPETGKRYIVHEFVPEGPEREVFYARYPIGSLSNSWWPHFSFRPSLMKADAIRGIGLFNEAPVAFELEFAQRYMAAGLNTAFFDAVVCLHTGRLTAERAKKANAYELSQVIQFPNLS